MNTYPAEVYSVKSVREFDRVAIEDVGIPGYVLMTRAAEAAVREAGSEFPQAKRWQVVCGAGNNAGDGYVVARLAAEQGIVVSVVALVDPGTLKGDAATAYEDFVAAGGLAVSWAGELDAEADLIVDAVLGSGLTREVSGLFAEGVEAINARVAPVMSLDIPTGLHGDSGEVMGHAVHADLTVTFVGLKSGLFLGSGPELRGKLRFASLDIPDHVRETCAPEFRRISDDLVRRSLPRRQRVAHKGDFGHVLIVGGGPGMPGAVRLCGEAALRAGAGLVSVATDPGHASLLVTSRPELMPHGIADAAQLEPLLERASVIAFGPGLGRSDWARALFEKLSGLDKPAVWDADALNLLAEAPAPMAGRVITPHPGEAGRLLDCTTREIQSDRRTAVERLQSRFGGIAVLKGSGSLVADGSGPPWLCTAGNPGMAAAGMGDVLTGMIAAFMAQGLMPADAALVGVEVHARAGDRAAAAGERGLCASDLLAEIRGLVNP